MQKLRKALLVAMMAAPLAGCDGPTPHFAGIAPVTVTVDGSTFAVRRRNDLAEAIRTNTEFAPRMGPIAGRAERAIAQATGCRVRDLRGDQAVILARLDC